MPSVGIEFIEEAKNRALEMKPNDIDWEQIHWGLANDVSLGILTEEEANQICSLFMEVTDQKEDCENVVVKR